MPGKKENLRDAEAKPDPDLKFSYNELLNELKKEHHTEDRLPGDVSSLDLSKATGLSRRWCSEVLKSKVNKGELQQVRIRNSNGKMIFVYRKLEKT